MNKFLIQVKFKTHICLKYFIYACWANDYGFSSQRHFTTFCYTHSAHLISLKLAKFPFNNAKTRVIIINTMLCVLNRQINQVLRSILYLYMDLKWIYLANINFFINLLLS
ncbi:hypothetical protein ENBRE01_0283 [Enteropsectra breve]|nr:hypothetical protein ENBRE01_0283 [Enteropsectra breve]